MNISYYFLLLLIVLQNCNFMQNIYEYDTIERIKITSLKAVMDGKRSGHKVGFDYECVHVIWRVICEIIVKVSCKPLFYFKSARQALGVNR